MIKAKKELGQNFMRDLGVVNNMINELGLETNDEVVEIGPGLGVFSDTLINSGTPLFVHLVEFDYRLLESLKRKYSNNSFVNCIHANILDWLPEFRPKNDFKILGSLPYYITSPILHTIIKRNKLPKKCVLLVQFEVARKIFLPAPDASYLSLFVHTFYDVKFLGKVVRQSFDPVPGVDGGIIKLDLREEIPISFADVHRYEKFLHHLCSNPRKMLNKVMEVSLLEKYGVNPTDRPQNLTVDQVVNLFSARRGMSSN